MRDSGDLQTSAQSFRFLNARGADKDRLQSPVNPLDLIDERAFFFLSRLEHGIGVIYSDHRPICGDHLDSKPISLLKLLSLARRGSRHAAHLRIHSDQVLDGDRAQHPPLLLGSNPFLRLDRGMQTSRPATILGDAPLELINRFNGAVFDDVIDVTTQQDMGVKSILNCVQQHAVLLKEEAAAIEASFKHGNAGIGEDDVSSVVVPVEMFTRTELSRDTVHLIGKRFLSAFPAGDDEGNSSFVDQDGVHFVDERHSEWPVNLIFGIERHLIAKVIESDFIRRTERNVTRVSVLSVGRSHALLDAPHAETEKFVNRVPSIPHPDEPDSRWPS